MPGPSSNQFRYQPQYHLCRLSSTGLPAWWISCRCRFRVFYLLLLVAGYLFFGAIRLLTGYQQSQTLYACAGADLGRVDPGAAPVSGRLRAAGAGSFNKTLRQR